MRFVPKVSVTLVFDKVDADMIERNLREKYNQPDGVLFASLCKMALLRESRQTKVNLVGIELQNNAVHKSWTRG